MPSSSKGRHTPRDYESQNRQATSSGAPTPRASSNRGVRSDERAHTPRASSSRGVRSDERAHTPRASSSRGVKSDERAHSHRQREDRSDSRRRTKDIQQSSSRKTVTGPDEGYERHCKSVERRSQHREKTPRSGGGYPNSHARERSDSRKSVRSEVSTQAQSSSLKSFARHSSPALALQSAPSSPAFQGAHMVEKAVKMRSDLGDACRQLHSHARHHRKQRDDERKVESAAHAKWKEQYGAKYQTDAQLAKISEQLGVKTANKFKSIRDCFQSVNRNGDTYVEIEEAEEFFKLCGYPQFMAKQHFDRVLDKNGTGKVHLQEFTDHFCHHIVDKEYKVPLAKPAKQILPQADDELEKVVKDVGDQAYRRFRTARKAFRSVDDAQDGALGKEEMRRFFRMAGYEQKWSQRFLDNLNTTGEKDELSYDEFDKVFGPLIQPSQDE